MDASLDINSGPVSWEEQPFKVSGIPRCKYVYSNKVGLGIQHKVNISQYFEARDSKNLSSMVTKAQQREARLMGRRTTGLNTKEKWKDAINFTKNQLNSNSGTYNIKQMFSFGLSERAGFWGNDSYKSERTMMPPEINTKRPREVKADSYMGANIVSIDIFGETVVKSKNLMITGIFGKGYRALVFSTNELWRQGMIAWERNLVEDPIQVVMSVCRFQCGKNTVARINGRQVQIVFDTELNNKKPSIRANFEDKEVCEKVIKMLKNDGYIARLE